LSAAAKLGWIDAIMTTYNFRRMQDAEMNSAIDACNKAGIGLVAMKTVALTSTARKKMLEGGAPDPADEQERKLMEHFLKQGFSDEQVRIKTALSDERISSACVGMQSIATLSANVAAVLDKTKLTDADMAVLRQYADATCDLYCAGCANICDAVLPDMPYVSDVMRYLMYYNSYGEKDMARELFAQIPPDVRGRLLAADYSLAEARCPQCMPIGKLVAEAVSKLA
jgi:predicted aldo/keto reductase-like oxidoreductase